MVATPWVGCSAHAVDEASVGCRRRSRSPPSSHGVSVDIAAAAQLTGGRVWTKGSLQRFQKGCLDVLAAAGDNETESAFVGELRFTKRAVLRNVSAGEPRAERASIFRPHPELVCASVVVPEACGEGSFDACGTGCWKLMP